MAESPLREDAPLLAAYLDSCAADIAPFTIPGHKRRADALDAGLAAAVAGDVPLHAGLDTMRLTAGTLREAEQRAARLWGADWCRFSTGGATHANQAVCLALGRPGDEVVVARTLHRSTLLGLVLADLRPVWLPTRVDPVTGVPTGATAADVRDALQRHPAARAVLLTEPGYLGTIGELPTIAAVTAASGAALVVDQAWGAHLGFSAAVPPHALAVGADALVTSAHKALPAYSQAALVLARTSRLDTGRLDAGFDAGHTTSPAGAILASIDGARALLAARGAQLVDRLVGLVDDAREQLRARVPGLLGLDTDRLGAGRFDPAKLVLLLAGTGADGLAVEADLVAAGLPVELADRDVLVPMVTLADDASTVRRLLETLVPALLRRSGTPRPLTVAVSWQVQAQQELSPRQAWFAPKRRVPLARAAGLVAGELVAVYPPGVPVLAPGERVDAALLDGLAAARSHGARIAYATDPALDTLLVVDASPRSGR